MTGKTCKNSPKFSLKTAKFLTSNEKVVSKNTNFQEIAVLEDRFMDDLDLPEHLVLQNLNYSLMLGDCEYKYYELHNKESSQKSYFLGGTQTRHPNEEMGKDWKNVKNHRQSLVLNLLDTFHEWADYLGIVYQINSGTSLGLCRNGRPFRWDHDGDVYVSPESFKKIEMYFNAYATNEKRCRREKLKYDVKRVIEHDKEDIKYVYKYNISEVFPNRSNPKEKTMCDFQGRSKMCMDFEWNGVDVRLLTNNAKRNKMHGIHYQFATMKKYVNNKFTSKNGVYDPDTYAHVDIFVCQKMLCDDDANKYRFKKMKSNLTCADLNENSFCKNFVLFSAPYGIGPFEDHTVEMYPEVKICGKKTRIDRLWFTDREKYCKIYSDAQYEKYEGRNANKSGKVKMKEYLQFLEKYGKYGKYE